MLGSAVPGHVTRGLLTCTRRRSCGLPLCSSSFMHHNTTGEQSASGASVVSSTTQRCGRGAYLYAAELLLELFVLVPHGA